MKNFKRSLNDFVGLFFPAYCSACDCSLLNGEESICLRCQMKLPRTAIHDERGNQVEKIFWGRVDVQLATAFLKMPHGGMAHHLIHELKYRNNQQVGIRLGKLFGHELKRSDSMSDFDVILPVPLHPKRLYFRGYNQCDCIAAGLESTLGVPVDYEILKRIKYNDSQTRMGRYARWKNVETIFNLTDPTLLEGKSVLLVDDVITTGATIEACAQLLNGVSGLKLAVAALAIPA